ncbi:MAG: hypothetical protein A2293_10285 [Elusimicrobia bacterium RIFOXYB2_FULL_49_7]|nr:MAG: hypothetical protein A2293_10285 [Elusimicrobia bacterium RIFOXYB2_FULL_49_7]
MNLMNFTIFAVITTALPIFSQLDSAKNIKNDNNAQSQTLLPETVVADLPISDSLVIPSLDFKSADIRDVLRAIATKYNLNVWLAPEVRGEIPVHLTNIKVKDALKFVIERYGYTYKYRNNVIEVSKPPLVKVEVVKPPIQMTVENNKLSFDFKDAEIDSIVRKYSSLTNINIVLDKAVKGVLSGRLNGVEIRQGLRILFESNGYEVKESNDIFYISTMKLADSESGTSTMGGAQSGGRFSVRVSEGKVSFQINNGDLRQIINEIANQSGVSIFIYGDIKGRISARADSLAIESALQYLLRNTPYTFWKNGSIYFIGDQSAQQVPNSELIELKYIKAEEVLEILPKTILDKAAIKVIKGQNGIMVIGPYEIIVSAREYLALVDRPISQILIEALVVDFSLEKMNEIGFKLFMKNPKDTSSFTETFFPAVKAQGSGTGLNKYVGKVTDFFNIKQIVKLPSDFRAQIGLLENAGVANVQSTPQVATLNGNTAVIKIVNKQYILLTSEIQTDAATSVQQKTTERLESFETTVSLSITPWVTSNREVTVQVKPIFQIPGISPDPRKIPPPVNSREIESTVRLSNGETYILGGIITTSMADSRESVPFLGRIPVLGYLFSYTTKKSVKNKMMIFLTPHIYYGSEGAVDEEEIIRNIDK